MAKKKSKSKALKKAKAKAVKKKKTAKRAAAKPTKAKKSKKPAKAQSSKAKRPAAKKVAKKAAAAKPAKKKTVKKKKQVVGEGDYAATRAFDKDQASFVKANKAKIPAMGKAAEAALEGPEGDALREAEATAAARSRDNF